MSEIINETLNELNKPTQNNVFSIEDAPVTVLEKINQVERYLKQIDTSVDTSINTANEALEKANNAFEANGTLVKINGENQLTWSADFAESERQKSITDGAIVHEKDIEPVLIYDKDTKNTIGGTAYTDGIPINNTYIGNDFSSYKKVEIIGVNRLMPIISTIDLTLKTNDNYYYGSGGMTYNAPFGDAGQYYLFMGCAIAMDKLQLILYKSGYNDVVETEHKVIRIVGYK